MNGKGSKPRPLSISYSKFVDNFDQINWDKKISKKQSKIVKHVEDIICNQIISELPDDLNKNK